MAHPLSSVIIRPRTGAVRAETAHLNYELLIDGVLAGYYETRLEAEKAAQFKTRG